MRNLLARPSVIALLFAVVTWCAPGLSLAAVFVSINVAPPVLPVYTQPIAPGPGYIWTPGYWAYGDAGYYWVPGTWVLAPFIGALWTPGWWGWGDDAYVWHAGYWGPHVGFYGGINYGFGYSGVGYQGGRWNNGTFMYNAAVNHINRTTMRNTYNQPVSGTGGSRASFNGGNGGVVAQPTAEERLAEHDSHRFATPAQVQQQQAASANRAQLASVNHGTPAIAATARPTKPVASGTRGRASTTIANSAAQRERSTVGATTPQTAAVKRSPSVTTSTYTTPTNERAAVATKVPAAARVRHAPAVVATPKPAVKQRTVATPTVERSTRLANTPTQTNPGPRLAASHATNSNFHPNGNGGAQAAAHAQAPAGGGHNGGARHEEDGKAR